MGRHRVSKAWQGSWLALTVALSLPVAALAQAPEPGAATPAEVAEPAEDEPSERAVITPFEAPSTRARVVQRPSSEEIGDFYPEDAQRRELGGKATVECEIANSQRLVNCVLTEETPRGLGFGAALLRVATLYRVAPPTYDGKVIEGAKFTIPMTFVMGPPAASPSRPATAAQSSETGAGDAAVVPPEPPPKEETPEERLKRLGPLKRSDGVLWAPIGFAIVVLAGLGRALMPMRRGRRVPRPADQRA